MSTAFETTVHFARPDCPVCPVFEVDLRSVLIGILVGICAGPILDVLALRGFLGGLDQTSFLAALIYPVPGALMSTATRWLLLCKDSRPWWTRCQSSPLRRCLCHFFALLPRPGLRCLSGDHRGSSGRSQVKAASAVYLVWSPPSFFTSGPSLESCVLGAGSSVRPHSWVCPRTWRLCSRSVKAAG